MITQFLQEKFADIEQCWESLPDSKKIDFYKDLLKYSVPQYSSVDASEPKRGIADDDLDHRLRQLSAEE